MKLLKLVLVAYFISSVQTQTSEDEDGPSEELVYQDNTILVGPLGCKSALALLSLSFYVFLIYQHLSSFQWWVGVRPSLAMRSVLLDMLLAPRRHSTHGYQCRRQLYVFVFVLVAKFENIYIYIYVEVWRRINKCVQCTSILLPL